LGAIWDGSQSIIVNEGDKHIALQGLRLEIGIEDKNKLRMSLVETLNNCESQHNDAVLDFKHMLECRRKDLAINRLELKEIITKLDAEDIDENVEQELEIQAHDKRVIIRTHSKEIKKLEAQTSVSVNYRKTKTGYSALFPPGLTLQPTFLSRPVCWCPSNVPETTLVEETTMVTEEMPLNLTSARETTAYGIGLKCCTPNEKSTFIITAKDNEGKLSDIGGDQFVIESKDAEVNYSVLDKKNGVYEVSYSPGDVELGDQISLAVTLGGCPIIGSPFSISLKQLLLEVSSTDILSENWLDEAVEKMANIPRATVWVQLCDTNGSEVYKSSGVTSCAWTKNKITAPNGQQCDGHHTNAIYLDNGDRMIIIGQHNCWAGNLWLHDLYRKYSITIIAGGGRKVLKGHNQPRRMIITTKAPNTKLWTIPENRISFARDGFKLNSSGNWPKFSGTFRIYYKSL